jgi:hypothetical protein
METLQVRTRRCGQVKGVLDGDWAEWFEGLEVRAVGDTTVISGTPRHDGIRARLEDDRAALEARGQVDQQEL